MRDEDFQEFYDAHARRLWAYAARISGDRSLADDVVQEAFVRVLEMEHFGSMTEEHRKNYLYKVASNLVKRRHRRAEQLPEVTGPATEERMDERIAVRRAMNGLKAEERNLLWLAYVEEFSHREIGAIAGYRENSVRPLLHRAKRRLLKLLGGEER